MTKALKKTALFLFKSPLAGREYSEIKPKSAGQSSGFSLIEISIALGVFAFAILAILGLLSLAVDTSRDTQVDSALTSVIYGLDAKLRRPLPTPASEFFDPYGKPATSNAPNVYYRATITKISDTKVASLFSLIGGNRLGVWAVQIEYPHPAYSKSSQVLLGNSLN